MSFLGKPGSYLWAVGIVALCTLACWAMFDRFDKSNLIMVYLLGVTFVATRHGRRPSALAAVLSVAAFDFFFVPPYMTFAVGNSQYLVTFAVMLLVGVLISTLAVRVRAMASEAEQARLAAESERLRSTLLSSVSHDLRTPLATITGAASSLLQAPPLDPAAERELKEAIYEEAERLNRLVTNLLDMTRLESGTLHLTRDWHSVEELAGTALARLERALGDRPVRVSIPADLPLLAVDGVLIEQVLVNLLDNAIKYTDPATPLLVTARGRDGGVTIEVADEGPGLPAGAEERVFEKFYRGASGQRGFGLGLPICKAIVAAHGGRIWAEGNVPRGAIFRFTLPVDATPPPFAPEEAVEREGA